MSGKKKRNPRRKGSSGRCSNCGQSGHYAKTCRNIPRRTVPEKIFTPKLPERLPPISSSEKATFAQIYQYAIEQMTHYGLLNPPYPWKFKFDRSVSRFGSCSWRRRTITLSKYLASLNSFTNIKDCILHELAHSLVPPKSGHNAIWRSKAIEIGTNPQRTYGEHVIQPKHPWIGTCLNCGRIKSAYRRTKSACGKCCDQFNRGKFDPRFLYQWKRNT